jgi:hypothetical protein
VFVARNKHKVVRPVDYPVWKAIVARVGLLDNMMDIIAAFVRLEYAVVQLAEALRRVLK